MKSNAVAALALVLGLLAGRVLSQDAKQDPVLDAWTKFATPGEAHARLKPLAGTFDAAVKSWPEPTKPPIETKGTCEKKLILGGRFLEERYSGEFAGGPYSGVGITGFDNLKKRYTSVWVDTLGTAILASIGTIDDAGKTIVFAGDYDDPVSGKKKTSRSIVRIASEREHTVEMFEEGQDGKEHKVMEITYTRR